MSWFQKEIALAPKPRGFHLVTAEIVGLVPEIAEFKVGIAHVFVLHTSASLTINENADPSVRTDMESYFNQAVPENEPYYRHTMEGPDDMPAHIKASMMGSGVTVPIAGGNLRMGTWQGIYLCEHRNRGGARRVMVTIQGER
jgi:secondary thiamine-phosphate synthase enzyme